MLNLKENKKVCKICSCDFSKEKYYINNKFMKEDPT